VAEAKDIKPGMIVEYDYTSTWGNAGWPGKRFKVKGSSKVVGGRDVKLICLDPPPPGFRVGEDVSLSDFKLKIVEGSEVEEKTIPVSKILEVVAKHEKEWCDPQKVTAALNELGIKKKNVITAVIEIDNTEGWCSCTSQDSISNCLAEKLRNGTQTTGARPTFKLTEVKKTQGYAT